MNLYISDLHFGHKNVIIYDHRPFAGVDEMDHVLIELWNARVCNDDHVYIVGDLCYKNDHPEQWYLRQLKGRKHLVIGNHDNRLLKNDEAMAYFGSVDSLVRITDGDKALPFAITLWLVGMERSMVRGTYTGTFMEKDERSVIP